MQARSKQSEAPPLSLDVCSAYCSQSGNRLQEQCVVEMIWTVYVTEPLEGLYINFKDYFG